MVGMCQFLIGNVRQTMTIMFYLILAAVACQFLIGNVRPVQVGKGGKYE